VLSVTPAAIHDHVEALDPTGVPLEPVLFPQLQRALHTGNAHSVEQLLTCPPADRRDELLSLLALYDLHLAPIDQLGGGVELQHDLAVRRLTRYVEHRFTSRLPGADDEDELTRGHLDPSAAVTVLDNLAGPSAELPLYEWVAREAAPAQVYAVCALDAETDTETQRLWPAVQLGLTSAARHVAAERWSPAGDGDDPFIDAERRRNRVFELLGVQVPGRDRLLEAVLSRITLGAFLAVNRSRQPELMGLFTMAHVQRPRRLELLHAGLARVEAPDEAISLFATDGAPAVHERHTWLTDLVAPLAQRPRWGDGMARGARWRAQADRRVARDVLARFSAQARSTTG
jgi:hypothetical protein